MIRIARWRTGRGWEVDIRVAVGGRRVRLRRRSPFSGKRETKAWAQELVAEIQATGGKLRGGPVAVADLEVPTIREYARTYLAASRVEGQKPSTVAAKERILRLHVVAHLGEVPVDRVGAREVSRLKAAMVERERPAKPKTINNVLAVLSGMLRHAAEHGVMNAAPRVRLLKVPRQNADFYTHKELDALVRAAKGVGVPELLVVLLAADAGLRSGEIAALRTSDIDLAATRPVIHVAASLWEGEEGATKSGRARTVPLTPRLASALRRVPTPIRGAARVIQRADGRDVTARWIGAAVKRVERAAGRPQTGRVHVLRHTFCSHLVMAGVHLRVIQDLAGHADISTTLRYAHLAPDATDQAIRKLGGSRRKRGDGGETVAPKRKKARKRARK